MLSALKEASALEEIWVDALSILFAMDEDKHQLREVLESTSLNRIHCLGARFRTEIIRTMEDLQYSEQVQKMMVYEDYSPDGYVAVF